MGMRLVLDVGTIMGQKIGLLMGVAMGAARNHNSTSCEHKTNNGNSN
jgi:hypothetical protein